MRLPALLAACLCACLPRLSAASPPTQHRRDPRRRRRLRRSGLLWRDQGQNPNLDRLAREGARFTDAHATASVCTPKAGELAGAHRPAGDLRGWKYLPYEGGTRIPFFVSWPGKVQTGVDDRMIGLNDLLATCATLVGQKLPAGVGRDSLDQSSVLLGRPGAPVCTEIVGQGISNTLTLRSGDWKFIPASPQEQVSGMGAGADPHDRRWTASIVPERAPHARKPDSQSPL